MPKPSFIKRSLSLSYFSSITSTTLVLFILGTLGILLYDAVKLSRYVQENVGFTVVIRDQASPSQMDSLEMEMRKLPYVKDLRVITKEMAEKEMRSALGEDFVKFLGYNPLPITFDVRLHYAFADPANLKDIEKSLMKKNIVKEIVYPSSFVSIVDKNLTKIAGVLILLFGLMLLVSIFLINGAIRLEMYSNRYTLMVMNRVGATDAFIRQPYIQKAWRQGAIAGAATSVLLLLAYLGLYSQLAENLAFFISLKELMIICLLLVLLGIVIVSLCTWFSVSSVLNAKLEKHELFDDNK